MKNLLFVLLLYCGSLSAGPQLTVYRTGSPPAIDGRLDDSCWESAAGTFYFTNAQDEGLPGEQTRAQICYDDEHLYVGIEAFEGMLQPALNMLHLVKAERSGADAAVFGDDCIELFLQPSPGGQYYHFAANSADGTYDGIAKSSEWDSGWTCRSRRGSTSYTVEAAIPLRTLKAPPTGQWRLNITRTRPQAGEHSTWSGLKGNFHQPAQFGVLRFADAGPAITRAVLDPGESAVDLRATLRNTDQDTALTLRLTGPQMDRERSARGNGEQQLRLAIPADLQSGGRATVSCELSDGETVLASAAPIQIRRSSAVVQLHLRPQDVIVQGFRNGQHLRVDNARLDLDLDPGVNVLALQVQPTGSDPAVSPALLFAGRQLPLDWRVSSSPPKDWQTTLPVSDAWAAAGPIADPENRKQLWSGGRDPLYLVGVLYVGSAQPQLFPKTDTFSIPADSSQLMRAYLHADQSVPAEGYRMIVEVPEMLQFVGFEPMSTGSGARVETVGSIDIGEHTLTRYAVHYDAYPGRGMELSMRWGDETGTTIAYEPVLRSGGTHDWRHLTTTLPPPRGAVSAHPLIIKWQKRDYTGTFWVDNVVFREKGSDRNLLRMGTFDEPGWKRSFPSEGPDGSKCYKVVAPAELVDRQQACWVDQDAVVDVDPAKEYIVELDVKCERLGSSSSRPAFGMLFRAPADAPPGTLPMYTYLESLDGALIELPRHSTVKVLPPLKNRRPRRARISPCYYSSRFQNPDVEKAYAESCWKSGITWIYGRMANGVVPELLPRGLDVFLSIPWHAWHAPAETRELLEANPSWQALDFEGKRLRHTVCPTFMLSDEGTPFLAALEGFLLKILEAEPYKGANWDLEQPVIDPPTFCTCHRCLTAFHKTAGLAADLDLSPDLLLETYPDQWTDFRCSQNAELAGHLKRIVGKADRPIEFSMYSGYQSRRTREHYGVDWARLKPHLDFAIAGYNGGRSQVEETLEALNGVPFMGGEMWYLSDTNDARPAPNAATWRNRILRQFVHSGCNGCLIWYLPTMDGGAFYATSEAAAIIAEHEDTLRHDHRCDEQVSVDGIGKADWAAFRDGDRILVMLLNFAAEAVETAVTTGEVEKIVHLPAHGTRLVWFE